MARPIAQLKPPWARHMPFKNRVTHPFRVSEAPQKYPRVVDLGRESPGMRLVLRIEPLQPEILGQPIDILAAGRNGDLRQPLDPFPIPLADPPVGGRLAALEVSRRRGDRETTAQPLVLVVVVDKYRPSISIDQQFDRDPDLGTPTVSKTDTRAQRCRITSLGVGAFTAARAMASRPAKPVAVALPAGAYDGLVSRGSTVVGRGSGSLQTFGADGRHKDVKPTLAGNTTHHNGDYDIPGATVWVTVSFGPGQPDHWELG